MFCNYFLYLDIYLEIERFKEKKSGQYKDKTMQAKPPRKNALCLRSNVVLNINFQISLL